MLSSKYQRLFAACVVVLLLFIGGVVVLANRSQGARTSQSVPQLSHEAYQAQKQQLLSLLRTQGAPASFTYLQTEAARDPAVARECHPLLHQLGHGAYEQYGGFTGAMEYQNELCNSGYTHGVIESYFKASSDIPALVTTTCDTNAPRFTQWQCFHGIGHGVMLATEKNVTRSIELCEVLPDDFSSSSCVNGLFMERFILVDHTGEHTSHNMSSVDTTTCQSQPQKHKADCYFYLPTAYLSLNPNQYEAGLKWCEQLEKEYITTCISGIGSQAMKENVTMPTVAQEICSTLESTKRDACIRGAIGLYINHSASSESARPLCQKEFAKMKALCTQVINSKKQSLDI